MIVLLHCDCAVLVNDCSAFAECYRLARFSFVWSLLRYRVTILIHGGLRLGVEKVNLRCPPWLRFVSTVETALIPRRCSKYSDFKRYKTYVKLCCCLSLTESWYRRTFKIPQLTHKCGRVTCTTSASIRIASKRCNSNQRETTSISSFDSQFLPRHSMPRLSRR